MGGFGYKHKKSKIWIMVIISVKYRGENRDERIEVVSLYAQMHK